MDPRPLAGDVPHLAAAVADGVVVRLHVGVEARGAGRERERGAEARLRQGVERVVHGGEAHRRERDAEALEELLRRGVRRVGGELAHDGHALRGELQPRGPHARQHRHRALVDGGAWPGRLGGVGLCFRGVVIGGVF